MPTQARYHTERCATDLRGFCQQFIYQPFPWWYIGDMAEDETRQTIRLPDTLLGRLKAAADRDHRSVHGQMLTYIERGLDQDDRREKRAATIAAGQEAR
jgi:predicted transcriptional regulator